MPTPATFAISDQRLSMNACVISRVRGPLTEARLTEALSAVQRRHPLLRVRIVDGRSCTEEDVPAIPLRVLDCDEQSTTAVVERELSVPLPVERGPLIRVSWLRPESNLGTLVLTFHHVIGDGVSSGVLVRDLIGAASGTLNLPFRSLDTVTPLEEILPAELRGWRGHWRFLRLCARAVWQAATQGRPLQLRVARWVPPAERTIHVLGRSLNGALIGASLRKLAPNTRAFTELWRRLSAWPWLVMDAPSQPPRSYSVLWSTCAITWSPPWAKSSAFTLAFPTSGS